MSPQFGTLPEQPRHDCQMKSNINRVFFRRSVEAENGGVENKTELWWQCVYKALSGAWDVMKGCQDAGEGRHAVAVWRSLSLQQIISSGFISNSAIYLQRSFEYSQLITLQNHVDNESCHLLKSVWCIFGEIAALHSLIICLSSLLIASCSYWSC